MVTCRSTMTDQHVHTASCNHSSMLKDIAHQAMIDRGLQPDFSAEAENLTYKVLCQTLPWRTSQKTL